MTVVAFLLKFSLSRKQRKILEDETVLMIARFSLADKFDKWPAFDLLSGERKNGASEKMPLAFDFHLSLSTAR